MCNSYPNAIYTDVLVIGGGPVGLFSVFMLGQVKLDSILVDSFAELGGQCKAVYPAKYIYDIPGFSKVLGKDLIKGLKDQAEYYSKEFILSSPVKSVEKIGDEFFAKIGDKVIKSKAVVISTGGGSLKHKKPKVENIDKFEKVIYKLDNLEQFRGKKVAVIGGGDSAMDWICALSKYTSDIYVIHRRNFTARNLSTVETVYNLVKRNVCKIFTPCEVVDLKEKNNFKDIDYVSIKNRETGEIKEIEIDYLVPCFGLDNKNDLPYNINGLETECHKIVIDPKNGSTSVDGIYAVGDASYYKGRPNLIVCGFSEAALCAFNIRETIFSDSGFIYKHRND
ncbi:NAD(P)/FAD-dependent oxidoreductase [Candidatus Nesciobacter abundans]|uniref:Ferredoxin--NADP reductase n=1 Tax=Candidatus Nesciobacter abundans TaxID=2601668 RepID=A0A5C0UHB0_9PROT|nr:NAD(P)/FAD-dependent oxidoreductase [Candidatus Nesciobacter abundans]QEK38943.1 NAD(P)/FAD-dependent oxidoreductase [Candidatus Nesciobacter abundans]